MSPEKRQEIVTGALRYISGEDDDEAQNAYFEILELANPEESWPLLVEVVSRSKGIAEPCDIGVGLLQSFLFRHGKSHARLIAEGIVGNTRLIEAIRSVQGIHKYPELKSLLPVEVLGE